MTGLTLTVTTVVSLQSPLAIMAEGHCLYSLCRLAFCESESTGMYIGGFVMGTKYYKVTEWCVAPGITYDRVPFTDYYVVDSGGNVSKLSRELYNKTGQAWDPVVTVSDSKEFYEFLENCHGVPNVDFSLEEIK